MTRPSKRRGCGSRRCRRRDPEQPRQPFRFTVDDGALIAFAALWTRCRVEDELVESAVMLTTGPNEIAARVLNRMPVLLPGPAEGEHWLRGELDDALELLRPVEASRMSPGA